MQTPSRFAVVLVAVAGIMFCGAGSALADTPVTWVDPEPTTVLYNLVLFGGSTLGLIIVVSLFGLLTARKNFTPPPPSTDVEVHSGH
jgi:hypothetical protein